MYPLLSMEKNVISMDSSGFPHVDTLLRPPVPSYVKGGGWASLVVQWLRICLPMQGTWVRALVWEDPTCRGATGPVSHNY